MRCPLTTGRPGSKASLKTGHDATKVPCGKPCRSRGLRCTVCGGTRTQGPPSPRATAIRVLVCLCRRLYCCACTSLTVVPAEMGHTLDGASSARKEGGQAHMMHICGHQSDSSQEEAARRAGVQGCARARQGVVRVAAQAAGLMLSNFKHEMHNALLHHGVEKPGQPQYKASGLGSTEHHDQLLAAKQRKRLPACLLPHPCPAGRSQIRVGTALHSADSATCPPHCSP